MDFRKRLTLLVGANFAVFLILGLGIFFLKSDISAKAKEISGLRQDFEVRTQGVNSLSALKKDYEKAKEKTAILDQFFPAHDQLINFQRDMTLLAFHSGVTLTASIYGDEKDEKSKLGKVQFLVNSSGRFDNLIKLLNNMKQSKYYMETRTLDLATQSTEDGSESYRMDIRGYLYSYYNDVEKN